MSYLRADAVLIRELLPPAARPPADADDLFVLYAVLMRAKGEQVMPTPARLRTATHP